ncbi:MAG: chemotaxis protein CheW, partial [Deltaproteobacteria bacterium]
GRGVGMDVVKEVVTSLQGSVAIDTKEGTGTTFRLQLPLTLAIIKGMVLEQGGNRIALPANFVDRVIPMTEEELKAGSIMDNNRLCLDIPGEGEVLPLVDLSQVFGLRNRSETRCVIVVRAGMGQKAALLADSAIGRQPLMVKPLDRFAENRYFSSASFADNELILVLNTPSLMAAQ